METHMLKVGQKSPFCGTTFCIGTTKKRSTLRLDLRPNPRPEVYVDKVLILAIYNYISKI
jgi:hypothetical protein